MKPPMGVFQIKNLNTNKVLIDSSIDMVFKWNRHKMELKFGNHRNKKLQKAKMFFELGIKYYPKSPNVYNSMADYYISQKDNKKALEYATKAYEISSNDYFTKRIKTLKN
ncbi:hypothetical protein [uncultured Lutibacter sp.]|uniref:hypothetical protein n=1 Tax=uncultured Lutibacter sp. TaxID=437739 RepID=UPI0026146907|nr:hypothetical protein [uncultured Lutibacter sp.]